MKSKGKDWFRIAAHIGALLPLAIILWDYWQGNFLIDPIREITSRTGKTALILLVLSLACTPIHLLFRFKPALRVRRALGLYAFMYVGLHFLTFVGLDYRFDLGSIGDAIFRQRYVLVGVGAFLLLLPLAITSTKKWQKRLGKNWKRLHRLVYPTGLLVIVHFLWLSKDPREPLLYGSGIVLLLIFRLPFVKKVTRKVRQRLNAGRRVSPGQQVG